MATPVIRLTITTTTETYEVRTNPTAFLSWEKRFDKMFTQTANGISMTEIYGLGYEATKAAGKVVPAKFEDWVKDLVDVDIDVAETENPTDAAPSAD